MLSQPQVKSLMRRPWIRRKMEVFRLDPDPDEKALAVIDEIDIGLARYTRYWEIPLVGPDPPVITLEWPPTWVLWDSPYLAHRPIQWPFRGTRLAGEKLIRRLTRTT